ncbi:CPBP family intramembrane metalloprotease [Oculatella sp. LEGE 06141]|uniref:CPBP family intramembrane glutamic endopeptidase n=1 Tax=Oculatella sp. LEGE 06141 TaxID=1828648 RepID=UPI0018829BC4|nr:type II CAAX endopeptidase family protein [Oculatella sp. LEGE 06141]MBE9178079.1 CPBP family intramembrane metalloprotease [Oculatella sp. LEGE 06141]
MTPKRLILAAITLVVVLLVGGSLFSSLSEAQITDRLQLYQTDLLLSASEIQVEEGTDTNLAQAREALLGENPLETALNEYQEVRQTAQANLEKLQARLQELESQPTLPEPSAASSTPPIVTPQQQQLEATLQSQQTLFNELGLRIGILQTQQNQVTEAVQTWTAIAENPAGTQTALDTKQATPAVETQPSTVSRTARTLLGLWSEPPQLLPDAERQLQQNLNGWFRYQALTRLYELQQRPDALASLQTAVQTTAQDTLVKLALVGTAPLIGCLIGVGLLVFLISQRAIQGKQAVLALPESDRWETPWDWEIVWQVLIVGFFFIGQLVLPFLLREVVGLSLSSFSNRARAVYALVYYALMAGSAVLVLYLSIRRFLPLPEGWFRLNGQRNWFVWGVGGYFVALPLMIGVSLLNQQIWRGQGGSNPLLQIVLEEGDTVALSMFFFTAAVAAPVFEELLFRGFLLPSLTRYVPAWGAIALSSLLFAVAHLSLSEVIPLAVLGSVLGFVYVRSRSLLAPMLLHSLWNSATMLGLFLLGSGNH